MTRWSLTSSEVASKLFTPKKMAVITRYFGIASAGANDGTTWADRKAFHTTGTIDAAITGFNFSGSDSLLCYIGPGTHTITAGLADAGFANPPTDSNPLVWHGCDSSGNPLTPPDPDWTSDQVPWDYSSLPVIATTTNIVIDINWLYMRLITVTASGRTGGAAITPKELDWCVILNSTNNTGTQGLTGSSGTESVSNSYIYMSGAAYSVGVTSAGTMLLRNTRLQGVTGTSGTRAGAAIGTSGRFYAVGCTIFGFGGVGLLHSSADMPWHFLRGVISNCGGNGITGLNSTQASRKYVSGNMITGNGAWGADGATGVAQLMLVHNRLRDNASGNTTGLGNIPELESYTTDSDDTTEYVNAGSFDFRIKIGAPIHGQGYGVSDQAYGAGGGIARLVGSGLVG
jgi:hypothetical protein